MKYKGLETSFSLLYSYEQLALQYRRKNEPRAALSEEATSGILAATPSMNYANYNYTFSLLNINAAVLEGIMRSILSEIVSEEVERQIALGTAAGRSERSHSENVLNKFYIEIDSQGGWDRLKGQYATYLGLSIDKEVSPETQNAISALFLLRNIFAHGTSIIHPSEKVPDELRDEPLFKWQSRLQSARVYLEKNFGHKDIFENLAEYSIPEHFMQKTKGFLSEILPKINHSPIRSQKTINILNNYSFGYRHFD